MKSLRKKQIRHEIVLWFSWFGVDERFTTDDVVQFVLKSVDKNLDPGTIRRYLRQLRDDGLINYVTVGDKKEKIIAVRAI